MPTLDDIIANQLKKGLEGAGLKKKSFDEMFEDLAFSQKNPSDSEFEALFGKNEFTADQIKKSAELLKDVTPAESTTASEGGLSAQATRAINAARQSPLGKREAQFSAFAKQAGATPTRAEAPVATYGKGSAEGGFKFLKGLSEIAPQSKLLDTAITGAASGFGKADVYYTPKRSGGFLPLEVGKGSLPGSYKDIRVGLPGAGSFHVLVPQDTIDLGRGLEAARQRAAAVQAERAKKKAIGIKAKAKANARKAARRRSR